MLDGKVPGRDNGLDTLVVLVEEKVGAGKFEEVANLRGGDSD